VDVAFWRARGKERAAPHSARSLRDETFPGPQPVDESLVPEPAEDTHFPPTEALAFELNIGDGGAGVVEQRGQRHHDAALLAG
jgi:hypothetical protein